jgi:hypothetical protein
MAGGGEMVSDDVKFHQGTDALVGREPYRSPEAQQAYAEAMNPGVFIAEVNMPRGIFGAVDGRAPDIVQLARDQSPAQREQTLLHEMEHSMDFRGGDILGRPNVKRTDQSHRAYYLMNKDWSPIRQFVDNVSSNREKLEQFFGMPMTSGYLKMTPERVKEEKAKYGRDAMLPYFDEQLASLSALEQTTGKSLTRDPEMRKLFPNTQMMAVYDALTGLRQTRLDARDLPPHTPLPSYTYETNPVTRFIREKTTGKNEYGIPIKRADGGPVMADDEVPSMGLHQAGANRRSVAAAQLNDIVNAARQDPNYPATEEYLKARDAVPSIRMGYLPPTINGMFTSFPFGIGSGDVKISDEIPAYFYKNNFGPSLVAHEMAHAADRQMEQQALEQRGLNEGRGTQFSEAYEKLVGKGGKKRTELARRLNPEWAKANRDYRSSPEEIVAHGVGAFSGVISQDSAPLHVDATAAQEYQILLDLARRNVGQRPTGIERIPVFFKKIMGYKDGGAVEPTPEELEAASRPAFRTSKSGIGRNISTKPGEIDSAIIQGLSETPYNVVGTIADLPALVMRPFGYTNPTPVMGSDWIKQQMTRLGIRPEPPTQPTARAFYELSQLGGALVNPTAPVRAAAAAGQATGRAAKEMLQDFQTYNRELAAPGASYAVKPKGGEFTMVRPPGQRSQGVTRGEGTQPPRIDAVEYYLKNEVGTRGDNALDQWVTDKLGRYMRRDMASPDDQFVKAAEQGRPLHFMPNQQRAAILADMIAGVEDILPYTRRAEGFNPKGEATTPYGRAVEAQVDMAVEPVRLEDFVGSEQRLRPQTAAQIAAEPERRVYEVIDAAVTNRLQFPQLVTTIQKIRENNGVFRAYGQGVPIPKELQFSDEAFKGLSPAQASERVAAFTKWENGAREKAATQAITKNPRIDTVKAEGGNTWVQVPDLDQNSELMDLVQDVGCAGGWCTNQSNYALSYGSGENRLHIMMDKQARPKVQMTLTTREPNPESFLNTMNDAEYDAFTARNPQVGRYGDVAATSEYSDWARLNPPTVSITELKGFGNSLDLKDSPALPAIQNYIKKLAAQRNIQDVSNLDGINMTDSSALDVYNAVSTRFDTGAARPLGATGGPMSFMEAMNKVRARIIEKNEGSRFIVKEDGPRLLQEALDDVLGVEKMAHGGMVERHRDDNRKYL